MKNLELKFYEKLGVRKFRDILMKLVYLIVTPLFVLFKIPKKERIWLIYNIPNNYIMKKGNGLQDLKDFKKMLYFNSTLHIIALISNIFSIINGIYPSIFWLLLNSYCIMLQRYNYIRINNTIKKYEDVEKKKINNIKLKIKKNIQNPHIRIYSSKEKINENKKNIDYMLDNLSLKSLKKLKNLIEEYQLYNNKYLCANFKEKDEIQYEIQTKIKQKRI